MTVILVEMENYTLQFVSDIHLEKHQAPFSLIIQPSAPDLALCGDIGDPYSQMYFDFLKWCSCRWLRVFVITGNHEYFLEKPDKNKTMDKIDTHIRQLCNRVGPNVFFLQKGVFLIEEYKIAILGATLWSSPDIRRWDMLVPGFLGDPGLRGEYNAIYKIDGHKDELRYCHPSDIISIHLDHKSFIKKELSAFASIVPKDYRVIVLTHHLPTYALNPPEFADHPLKSTYASELDALIKEPVVAWICGHSHIPQTLRFESGTLVTLNPLGYKNQSKQLFSHSATIVVYRENIAIRRD